MLKVSNLNVFYGAIQALRDVSIEVNQGEIVAMIGSNGAGKSTLLRSISGLMKPRSGEIDFLGSSIVGIGADRVVVAGISQAPEGRRIFSSMTVQENLLLGAYIRTDKEIDSDLEKVLVRFPRLRERIKQSAGTLSGGEQQMLAIGRALMSRPKMLLLDEPSLGLAPNLIAEIFRIVLEIKETGTTVLLVEQNAHRALEISDRAYVLETGSITITGAGKDLLVDPRVKEAYLGG